MKKRVLSGIRATGKLHLGNYLGAVRGMLALQDDPTYETFYMVADLHTITTPYNTDELRQNRREIILDYLAAGLDPEKSVIFQQSEVPQHAELAFLLESVTTIAKMQHLPTFKEKVKQYPEHATLALLNYPALMAADILAYKAELVPVGIDQEPHLEIAREIARRMNQDYKTSFPEPKRFATKGEYVPSLLGAGKMSKSIEGSYINLSDNLEIIKAKIAKIPTDSGKGTVHPAGKDTIYTSDAGTPSPGTGALMSFVHLFMGGDKRREFEAQYETSGIRYGEIKKELSELIFAELTGFQGKRLELEANPEYVDQIIKQGNENARTHADKTVREVKEKMGLL